MAGGRGAAASPTRSRAHGSSRRIASAWYVPTIARRCDRAMRARNDTQGARGGIGVMDILDDEQHRTALREPTQHA